MENKKIKINEDTYRLNCENVIQHCKKFPNGALILVAGYDKEKWFYANIINRHSKKEIDGAFEDLKDLVKDSLNENNNN